ncbi:MAG: hypothetical protein HY986_07205 [Candidatus Melainabacteria bacterium]|nr:hypothetical protein [Candidatus Melainabacteria bacterium]
MSRAFCWSFRFFLPASFFLLMLLFAPFACEGREASQSLKLSGRVDELARFCSLAGLTLDASGRKVMLVRAGSTGYYSGILVGDGVEKVSLVGQVLTINLKRGAQVFQASIPIKLAALNSSPDTFQSPKENTNTVKLKAAVKLDEQKLLQLLSPYRIVCILDRSDSMDGGLGAGPQDVSRWSWCRQQLQDLTAFLKERGQLRELDKLSLVIFNESFEEYPIDGLKALETAFNSVVPEGATNLHAPLKHVLDCHLKSQGKRPLLVLVLTDGGANRGASLPDLLVEAANRSSNEGESVTICFFEIGKSSGSGLLAALDEGLVSRGAARDIVYLESFEKLLEVGLKQSLLDAVSRHGKVSGRL